MDKGFKRSLSIQNLLFPIKTIFSIIHSLRILKNSNQICYRHWRFCKWSNIKVAQLLGLPTLIQEQNSYPVLQIGYLVRMQIEYV